MPEFHKTQNLDISLINILKNLELIGLEDPRGDRETYDLNREKVMKVMKEHLISSEKLKEKGLKSIWCKECSGDNQLLSQVTVTLRCGC